MDHTYHYLFVEDGELFVDCLLGKHKLINPDFARTFFEERCRQHGRIEIGCSSSVMFSEEYGLSNETVEAFIKAIRLGQALGHMSSFFKLKRELEEIVEHGEAEEQARLAQRVLRHMEDIRSEMERLF